jgi:hypothetical protein
VAFIKQILYLTGGHGDYFVDLITYSLGARVGTISYSNNCLCANFNRIIIKSVSTQ